jgi:hypothetical protein
MAGIVVGTVENLSRKDREPQDGEQFKNESELQKAQQQTPPGPMDLQLKYRLLCKFSKNP